MISDFSHNYWVAGTFVALGCTAMTFVFLFMAKGDDLFRGDAE
jgi:hypothetical protein